MRTESTGLNCKVQRSRFKSLALVLSIPDIKIHMVTFPLIIDTFILLYFGGSIRDVKVMIFMKKDFLYGLRNFLDKVD